jgi:hypothetical protein
MQHVKWNMFGKNGKLVYTNPGHCCGPGLLRLQPAGTAWQGHRRPGFHRFAMLHENSAFHVKLPRSRRFHEIAFNEFKLRKQKIVLNFEPKHFPFSFSYAERNSSYKFANLFRLGIKVENIEIY